MKLTWRIFTVYMLIIVFTILANSAFGQITVKQFNAGWNEVNIVKLLDDWENFEVKRVYRVNIETYPKIQSDNNVVVLPTIIFYLDGDEAGRLQGNMKFQLETTTKELDKMVEEIYNEDKFN